MMRIKKLHEQMVEDENWLQIQPSLIPWEQGQETLEKIVDCILAKNREELFEKLIRRNHRDRPTYSQRFRHCLRYHWEKAKNDQPRCSASNVVKEIYIKYGQRNVFDSVVLTVAVVLQEFKSWNVFRPLYDKTFNSVAPSHRDFETGKKGNDDDCREHVFDELTGGLSDRQEQELNVILTGMEIDTLELLKKVVADKKSDKLEQLDAILTGMEPDQLEQIKTVILDAQLKSRKLDLVIFVKSTDQNPAKLDQVENGRLIDYGGKGSFIRWLRKAIYRRIASYYEMQSRKKQIHDIHEFKGLSPHQQAVIRDLMRKMSQRLNQNDLELFVAVHGFSSNLARNWSFVNRRKRVEFRPWMPKINE